LLLPLQEEQVSKPHIAQILILFSKQTVQQETLQTLMMLITLQVVLLMVYLA
jgi:hypothetical protein